ncbi:MAG: ribulose 1,5-bisphosphate carboxylase large subunit [Anaerolineae bacterium]|nr:ribulose 1,5-bisphosphate carboxylase large subunit [Anaerolineae bacterium]
MTLPIRPTVQGLSGERFQVTYHLQGNEAEARAKAIDITLEQTVEFPDDLVPDGDIRTHIVGRIEEFAALEPDQFVATISFAIESGGHELPQLLNVIFGNISIKPGIRVAKLHLPASLARHYRGPRFGVVGWRALLGVPTRPLLMTALKPMGLGAAELADIAYRCALGGLDIIKDDHSLTDQPFAPYHERVERCAEAVARANQQTGLRCQYMPNVTAPAGEVLERAHFAKQAGAGALLICPGLAGLDTMRTLADDEALGLPISSHPAFYGSMVTSQHNGIAHYALYGQMQRLAGADSSIYPNFGGRFAFSEEECRSIAAGCSDPLGQLAPIFPTPGGGMTLQSIPTMRDVYGQDVIYLIGGGLHRHSADLTENVKYFLKLVQA